MVAAMAMANRKQAVKSEESTEMSGGTYDVGFCKSEKCEERRDLACMQLTKNERKGHGGGHGFVCWAYIAKKQSLRAGANAFVSLGLHAVTLLCWGLLGGVACFDEAVEVACLGWERLSRLTL